MLDLCRGLFMILVLVVVFLMIIKTFGKKERAKGGGIILYIRENGEVRDVEIEPESTLSDLKDQLSQTTGDNSYKNKLYTFAGQLLIDDQLLSDAGFTSEGIIDVSDNRRLLDIGIKQEFLDNSKVLREEDENVEWAVKMTKYDYDTFLEGKTEIIYYNSLVGIGHLLPVRIFTITVYSKESRSDDVKIDGNPLEGKEKQMLYPQTKNELSYRGTKKIFDKNKRNILITIPGEITDIMLEFHLDSMKLKGLYDDLILEYGTTGFTEEVLNKYKDLILGNITLDGVDLKDTLEYVDPNFGSFSIT